MTDPVRWLTAFPSFGFLLGVEPRDAEPVCARFESLGVACRQVGTFTAEPGLVLTANGESAPFCDRAGLQLTGFGACG